MQLKPATANAPQSLKPTETDDAAPTKGVMVELALACTVVATTGATGSAIVFDDAIGALESVAVVIVVEFRVDKDGKVAAEPVEEMVTFG